MDGIENARSARFPAYLSLILELLLQEKVQTNKIQMSPNTTIC